MDSGQSQFRTEDEDRGKNFFFVTILLCVINILLYVYTFVNPMDYYLTGGMNYDLVVEQGEYFRFLTCMFLHGDVEHIAMNMLGLVTAGVQVESYLGALRTAIIYFASGAGGSILSLLFHQGERQIISIGASGAVFGLLVSSAIIQNKKQGKSLGRAIGFVLIYALVTYSEGIDLTGHLGGAIGGAIAAGLFSIGFTEDYREGNLCKVLGILITLLLSLGAAYFIIGL